VLTPAIRGAGQLPSASTSSDTDLVFLKMEPEVSEFSKYQVSSINIKYQVSSGTQRLGHQTGFVDQRQARTALPPGSGVRVLRVSSSTIETAELSGATQRHSGERHVQVGHRLRFPGCHEVGVPPQSPPQGRKSSAPALIVVNYHFSPRPSAQDLRPAVTGTKDATPFSWGTP
jgi:hypothetical protein